jgi:protein farnesyltransferase subunit beta
MASVAVEAELAALVAPLLAQPPPPLLREAHVPFLRASLRRLSPGHCSLDAARPWLVFWTVHSLALLGERLEEGQAEEVAAFLSACRAPGGQRPRSAPVAAPHRRRHRLPQRAQRQAP